MRVVIVGASGNAGTALVRRLRQRYGAQMPIFASFDFHGNMSLELVQELNYIAAYYTAPHVDIYEAGCRAVRALIECVQTRILPHSCFIPIPMVMPGEVFSALHTQLVCAYARFEERWKGFGLEIHGLVQHHGQFVIPCLRRDAVPQ